MCLERTHCHHKERGDLRVKINQSWGPKTATGRGPCSVTGVSGSSAMTNAWRPNAATVRGPCSVTSLSTMLRCCLRHRLWPPREAPRDVATSAASTEGPLRTSSHNGRRQREAATAAAGDVFHVRLWLRVTLHTTMHLVPLGHCDSPPVRLRVYKHTPSDTHTHTQSQTQIHAHTHVHTFSAATQMRVLNNT